MKIDKDFIILKKMFKNWNNEESIAQAEKIGFKTILLQ